MIGNIRNAAMCKKYPEEAREKLKNYMEEKKIRKEVYVNEFPEFDEFEYQDNVGGEDEVQEINHKKRGGRSFPSGSNKKLAKGKGPMDIFLQKRGTLRQTNIKDSCDKEARAMTIQKVASFFYDNGIPFNAANEAVGRYGSNLKRPSYHELRVSLLRKEVELTNEIINRHRKEWVKYETSIMADGWTDRKQRTLIKFLVNSPHGTVFIESIDASSLVKTREKLCELLDRYVERVVEQ